jgi:hypothetical protein
MRRSGMWWAIPLYVGLTLAMTYPLMTRLGSHYAGTGGDLFIFPWNDWWCRKCLLEGLNPYFTTWLYYPQGVSLVYHNFAWLNTALWLPLAPVVGSVAAYNLIFLFNIALGGIGMFALARYWTGDQRAAFLAGLVYAFWPCRMSHYNHPNMISTGWIPLSLLFVMRTIRERNRLGPALWGGLLLALVGLARWQHLIFGMGFVVLYLVWSVVWERRCWDRSTVLHLALLFGLALALMAPLLFPLVKAQLVGGEYGEDLLSTDAASYSIDLVSYFVPDRSHALFRPWLSGLWSEMRRGSYLGYGALVLAAMGVLKGPRGRWLWAAIAIGLLVMGLGPALQVAGRETALTLPYAWVESWLPVQTIRHPNRFAVYLGLPMALLAAAGAAWLLRRARRGWVPYVALGLLLLFEYSPLPFPTVQPTVPPFYFRLAQEEGDFAILDLPMESRTVDKLYMYYATVHGKRLAGGHVSRLPPSAYRFVDRVPWLAGLRRTGRIDPALGDISRQLRRLAEANIRYVILHPTVVAPGTTTPWRAWLTVRPAFEDAETVVYHTQPEYGRDFEFLAELGDGIGVIEAMLARADPAPGAPVHVAVAWGTRSAPQREWQARLALVSPAGQPVQWVDGALCTGWPTGEWGANAVARSELLLTPDRSLAQGAYTVTLALLDPATGAEAGQPFEVGHVYVGAPQPGTGER